MAERNSSRGGSRGSSRNSKKKDDLSIKVVLPPAKMSFPHFFEPTDTDNGDRYQANFLFPPKTDFSKLEKAMDDCMYDFFGDKDDWPNGKQDRPPADVIRDATEKDYEGYNKGWSFIKAASRDRIGIVDANCEEVTNPRDVYGGRWCRPCVTVKAYDNKSKGIGVYLNSVQVLDHDQQFGGRGPAKNDFDDWDGPDLSDDDRGRGTGHARPRDDDDDRGYRGRDRHRGDDALEKEDRRIRDDRDSRRGARDRDDDEPRRGRDREDDRDRDRGRGREDREDDRRGRSRDRDEEDTRGDRRGSSRDRADDERPSRGRDRDEDRGHGRDRDDDRRSSSRDRDEDERPSRSRGRDRDDEDRRGSRDRDWN